jgi:hypothetical protein
LGFLSIPELEGELLGCILIWRDGRRKEKEWWEGWQEFSKVVLQKGVRDEE